MSIIDEINNNEIIFFEIKIYYSLYFVQYIYNNKYYKLKIVMFPMFFGLICNSNLNKIMSKLLPNYH